MDSCGRRGASPSCRRLWPRSPPHLDHLTVVTNLEVKNSAVAGGNHATAGSAFLSCARAKRTEGSDFELGITIDQIAAREVGGDTPIPSLEIGTDLIAQVGNCDNGFACVYQNNLSWSSPTTPLPSEADPRLLFERLFGDGGTPDARRAEMRRNASILDWVRDDMARLQARLGAGDRVEGRRVSRFGARGRAAHPERRAAGRRVAAAGAARPTSVPAEWEDHVKLMFDLQVWRSRRI